MATKVESVLPTVLKSLEKADLKHKPFSYYELEDIFPEDFYQEMRDHLPEIKDMNELKHFASKRWDRSYARRIIEVFSEDDLKKISQEHRGPWLTLWRMGQDPKYQKKVLKMLQPAIKKRFEKPLKLSDFYVKMVITRDLDQYRIQIHPDTARKIVTMQFYLPPDDDHHDLGTIMHEKVPKEKRKSKNHDDKYKKIRQMKFGKNRGYGFAVNEKSFHSVDLITLPKGYTRDSVMLVFHGRKRSQKKDKIYRKEKKRGKPAS